MENSHNTETEKRVLGQILSKEDMSLVAGGIKTTTLPPVQCTPKIDNGEVTPTLPAL